MVQKPVPTGMATAESPPSSESPQKEPRVASFAFLKGGTTKTTLSVNTARHLAERNGPGSTLFIDFDPNGHATQNYDYGYDSLFDSGTDLDKVLLGNEADVHPAELALETPFKFDIIPSSNEHESIKNGLASAMGGSARLHTRVVEELVDDEYDYIIIDHPSSVGIMNNNCAFASRNLLFPMLPKAETIKGLQRTQDRLITPLEERDIDINVLAVVPNLLEKRIDQQTNDRELLEAINTGDHLKSLVPNFARITEEEWEKIDRGEMAPPSPGIRARDAITNGMKQAGLPLLDYDPDNDQNEHFEELAEIIEYGGIQR